MSTSHLSISRLRRGVEQCAQHIPLVHLFIAAVAVLVAGCGSSQTVSSTAYSSAAGRVETALRHELDRWKGTPHVLGGTTAAGMDCSAFVQRVFSDAFAIDLPRTTDDQVHVGRRVRQSELQPGDLVFFRPPTKTRHVGIYLSDGEFAHVSSTQGVTVSAINLPYWRDAYWTSRRILDHSVPVAATETRPSPPPRSSTPNSRRVGW